MYSFHFIPLRKKKAPLLGLPKSIYLTLTVYCNVEDQRHNPAQHDRNLEVKVHCLPNREAIAEYCWYAITTKRTAQAIPPTQVKVSNVINLHL